MVKIAATGQAALTPAMGLIVEAAAFEKERGKLEKASQDSGLDPPLSGVTPVFFRPRFQLLFAPRSPS